MKKNVFVVIAAILTAHLLGTTVASAQPMSSNNAVSVSASSDEFVIGEPIEVDCDEQSGANCSDIELGYGEYDDPVIWPVTYFTFKKIAKRTNQLRQCYDNRLSTAEVGFESGFRVARNVESEGLTEDLPTLLAAESKNLVVVAPGKKVCRTVLVLKKTKNSRYVIKRAKSFRWIESDSAFVTLKGRKARGLHGDEWLVPWTVAADGLIEPTHAASAAPLYALRAIAGR